MKGALLHILGDFFGSIGVVVSGLIMMYWEDMGGDPNSNYKYLADPLSSLLIVMLILSSAIPLLRECIHILLQSVPKHFNLEDIKQKLLSVDGIENIHDLHIWQLSNDITILTSHLECNADHNFMTISDRAKYILHANNIHASTLQPEYCNEKCQHPKSSGNRCHDLVCRDSLCQQKSCC